MLPYEEIARLKVKEATQSGLKAQQIHRIMQEQKLDRKSHRYTGIVPVINSNFKLQTTLNLMYHLLFQVITGLRF